MNNQNAQAVEGTKIANKLINKLAYSQLEEVKREVEIDELNAKIQQLTQANQQLESKNQQLTQANQQLESKNQQLTQSNQQLESENQQLKSKIQSQDSTATKDEKQPA